MALSKRRKTVQFAEKEDNEPKDDMDFINMDDEGFKKDMKKRTLSI